MRKQDKIDDLTWKYFKKQKIKELGGILLFIIGFGFLFLLLPYWLGHIGECTTQVNISNSTLIKDAVYKDAPCITFWDYNNNGLNRLLIIILPICATMVFIGIILYWIKSNWEEAKERAEEEVRK
ncbi:MAG: hypothetical protein PHD04_03460 [Candidatus Pacebacteria bacterium]|nr:hypothetical protein [Candidatus Paceibacterota bacterium]